MTAETTSELPIDRLRAGTMTDEEAIAIASQVVRMSRIHEHGQDVFNLLAVRLERVFERLGDENERLRAAIRDAHEELVSPGRTDEAGWILWRALDDQEGGSEREAL